ncbi:MAG: glycosyltransferase family 8 protein [Lachnospiraceae bacterium]|nr:glycosyltransferase family 8 protein [Lachnospiraceae bacterium]
MNICYGVNSEYIRYLCVSMTSLFQNNPEENIVVRVFYFDLYDHDRKVLSELAGSFGQEIQFVRVDKIKFAGFHAEPYPREAYLRLCVPYMLPDEVDRVLYLDVDTIVEKPLTEFYSTDFSDCLAVVCRDLKLIETTENGITHLIRDLSGSYFNSGVMLCNLKKIRKDFRFEDFIRYAKEQNYDLPYADQDILNGLFAGKVIYADQDRYNYMVSMEARCGYSEELALGAVIRHYAGISPWHRVPAVPSHKRWWYYARQTSFYDELLEMKLKGRSLPKRLQ